MIQIASGLILALALFSCKTSENQADSKSADGQARAIITDAEFEQAWKNEIDPFMAKGKTGFFTGREGARLEYIELDKPDAKANIVVVHGFTQNYRSFSELMFNFWNQGYAVHSYSQIGHGCSDHLLLSKSENAENQNKNCKGLTRKQNDETFYKNANYCKVHNPDQTRYIADLKTFVDQIKTPGRKTYLYCHSMGGGVCSRFIEQYPDAVDAALLNAPMHRAKSDPLPFWAAKVVLKTTANFSPEAYAPTMKDVPFETVQFNAQSDHSSSIRFEKFKEVSGSEAGFFRCGSTNAQARELLELTTELNKKENIAKIKIPVMLIAADRALDKWVEFPASEKFCDDVASCRLHEHDKTSHENYNEPDAQRLALYRYYLDFYADPSGFIKKTSKKF